MQNYKYLIIGGGMAADSAIQGIREIDKTGTIGMISKDDFPPYNRPPLSKSLWKNESEDTIWRNTNQQGVTFYNSCSAESIDIKNKTVIISKGDSFNYEKLLLATGGRVNRLPINIEGIIYYRNYSDYKNLREATVKGNSFLVIGGGFIGSEIAAALAMNNKKVTMVFPEKGICSGIFPVEVSEFLNQYYKDHGVNVVVGHSIDSIVKKGNEYSVITKNKLKFSVDGIVAGIGIKPESTIAESAGLLIDNGIQINELLQTSDPDIYAAGDVANFFSPALDKRVRFEHEDNANTMGKIAGKNMAGAKQPYHHLPFFYSDLFDIGYEAVGDIKSSYQIVEQWKDKFKEGIIYYLHHDRVKGVLLWNTWDQVENARNLISSGREFNTKTILNQLPK